MVSQIQGSALSNNKYKQAFSVSNILSFDF